MRGVKSGIACERFFRDPGNSNLGKIQINQIFITALSGKVKLTAKLPGEAGHCDTVTT